MDQFKNKELIPTLKGENQNAIKNPGYIMWSFKIAYLLILLMTQWNLIAATEREMQWKCKFVIDFWLLEHSVCATSVFNSSIFLE